MFDTSPLTVGPNGRFPTLAAAMSHLKEHDHDYAPEDVRLVLLPPGEWDERLIVDGTDFDFPQNITIRGDAAGTTLNPAGPEPAIEFTGSVTRFTLENVAVNAGGRAVAVSINGLLNESKIAGLSIEELADVGVRMRDVSSIGFRIDDLTISAKAGGTEGVEAIGVQIDGGGLKNATLSGGSITGAVVGVDVAAQTERLTLSDLTISGGTVGVRFGGAQTGEVLLRDVRLAGIKFSNLTRGVAFGSAPKRGNNSWDRSERLVITNCDFGDVEQPVVPSTHLDKVRATIDSAASTGNTARNAAADPLDLFP